MPALGSKARTDRLTVNFKPWRTSKSAAVSFCVLHTPGRTKRVSHKHSFYCVIAVSMGVTTLQLKD